MSQGDTITVIFGDSSNGSPGWRMQSFAESNFEFKVAADACAVGHFVPIPNTPNIEIIPGPSTKWIPVLPSLRRPGESFRLGLKAEDVNESTDIYKDLGLDSLGVVSLGMKLHAVFKVKVPMSVVSEIFTLGDMYQILNEYAE